MRQAPASAEANASISTVTSSRVAGVLHMTQFLDLQGRLDLQCSTIILSATCATECNLLKHASLIAEGQGGDAEVLAEAGNGLVGVFVLVSRYSGAKSKNLGVNSIMAISFLEQTLDYK